MVGEKLIEHITEDFKIEEIELPSHEWLRANFSSKSAMIRYLFHEKKVPVKVISKYLATGYRHVYNVANKSKPGHSKICPVCGK